MSEPRPLPDLRRITIFEVQKLIRIYIEEMQHMVNPPPTFASDILKYHARRLVELLEELP